MSIKILSVFIDESGDFGAYSPHAPYYIVSMVLHDQRTRVVENIADLDKHLDNLGYPQHSIHTGPLIRRESVYETEPLSCRKRLFNALFNFARKCPITYILIVVNKHDCVDIIDHTSRLSKSLAAEIKKHEKYFRSFDEVIVYYDNGQVELTKILSSVFQALLGNVTFRKARIPEKKLSQVADLICTAELIEIKRNSTGLTKSELDFFGSGRDFKKNYLKYLHAKRLE